jgi:hypothetical protein
MSNHFDIKDRQLHSAAAGIFVASDKINYLLKNERLHEVVECVGMIVLRRSQESWGEYLGEIERAKRAIEKLEAEARENANG